MMSAGSASRALSIDTIVDEVIWLLQAGGCIEMDCWDPAAIDKPCPNYATHLRDLYQCILVCKKWSQIGIVQLWSSYASDWNLLSLLTDSPHRLSWHERHFHGSDTRVSYTCEIVLVVANSSFLSQKPRILRSRIPQKAVLGRIVVVQALRRSGPDISSLTERTTP
jgi:hypothetical protein